MDEFGKFEYLIAKLKNIFFAIIRKFMGHRKFRRRSYYGKQVDSAHITNKYIKDSLMSSKPFLAARFGDTELRVIMYTIEIKLGLRKKFPKYIKEKMCINAGFFPADDYNLMKFGELMLESCDKVDLYGVWFNMMEDFVIQKKAPFSKLTLLESLEPYRHEFPWSMSLKGKKVLVIHPFEESIIKQYKRKELIFEDTNVLPNFELITLKAIQSNAGGQTNFDNWFDALEYMYRKTLDIDYEIAIIGCGAYGFPLAAKLKQEGKKVIHLGGATQLLFGIRGARWDIRPEMQYLFNENWIRANENERPKDADKVEGACYW